MNKKIIITIAVMAIVLAIGTIIYSQKNRGVGIVTPQENQNNLGKEREAAIAAIREFRGDPNLEVEYITTESHATQFGIGKEVKGENTYYYETPEEYKYPVEFYQEKEPIGGGCQVFEYEVDVETNEIVEMRMVYPEKYYEMKKEITQEELNQKCQETRKFLEAPPTIRTELGETTMDFSETNLEEIATDFLKKHAEKTWIRLNDLEEFKSQLIYSSKGNNHWWKWVDKNYHYYPLPEGFEITGIPPTVQVGISSGGYLMNYINNISYFELAMRTYDQK